MKTNVTYQMSAKEEAFGHILEDELDDEHPLWCVNEQIKGLLLGYGANEDHEMVIQFFRETGLPEGTVTRIHKAIVCSEKAEGGSSPETCYRSSRVDYLAAVIASCDCLTKTPEVKYHKPDCKYRLINERDTARQIAEYLRSLIPIKGASLPWRNE